MGAIETIAGILIILWILGLVLHIAGAFINVLLVLAIIMFLMRFFRKKAA